MWPVRVLEKARENNALGSPTSCAVIGLDSAGGVTSSNHTNPDRLTLVSVHGVRQTGSPG